MAKVVKHCGVEDLPTLEKVGFRKELVGYFRFNAGTLQQLVHLWKFKDDTDRRKHVSTQFQDDYFMASAT